MVPGSTFRYGSNFCRDTRSPRLSSRQPIEAAAMPFPSDETTPPVTKIYFAIDIPPSAYLHWFKHRRDALQILRRVHPQRVILGFHHADAISVLDRPQLFQPLQPLEGTYRKSGVGEQ